MCSDLEHKTHAGTTGMVFRLIIVVVTKQMIVLMINWNTIWTIPHREAKEQWVSATSGGGGGGHARRRHHRGKGIDVGRRRRRSANVKHMHARTCTYFLKSRAI